MREPTTIVLGVISQLRGMEKLLDLGIRAARGSVSVAKFGKRYDDLHRGRVEGFHHGFHENAVERVSVRRRRRDGRKDARVRLVCNGFGPIGAVAAIAASLRARHAGLWVSNARLLGTSLHDAL